ncbi:hypothetical protein VIBNISOn1_410017 [Vibrio nigripulchritudo SOn1]|uniref:Uncharacterized protein n=1 Tax=Vibrio nigripulchritudo SOn1 TaxID=1238450 RepID=A0AAV2VT02_9VIBR|nr:hypothetical protein VIBNISOn1_410017 [Vibrio nigripulchritudo SOn1]
MCQLIFNLSHTKSSGFILRINLRGYVLDFTLQTFALKVKLFTSQT